MTPEQRAAALRLADLLARAVPKYADELEAAALLRALAAEPVAEFDPEGQTNGSPKPDANPVAEPVAWMYTGIRHDGTPHDQPSLVWSPDRMDVMSESKGAKATPLYTAPPSPQREPVDFVALLREAEGIVRGKPVWKRFIDGTPLANDVPVWMVVFAQDKMRDAAPPRREQTCTCGDPTTLNTIHRADGPCYVPVGVYRRREPLTDEEIMAAIKGVDSLRAVEVARAIEAAHGITGEQHE